ncbi:alanine--tRNA ligase [candidate division WOR-3 bacterium JGI_Cruoil_03_44_89]|uniref:Alanine--tRNA ligase n=1 Tax=candidate division WOR-3 bacterium JGI_Cruoil_03_44_89 TaxID=1973748 RepID=A0A235BYS3_UNCW3|nr:MAG: alanine--tRNA ligase [candidate division WOR-3 bacterium JGI_Cruoil_03_44_89]
MYTSNQLRKLFMEYFTERGHTPVQSSPLVPKDDPTLLFTSAGMVQFKPLWKGDVPLPYKRAVSIQKCLRGSDIDEVKTTGKHHTFFEMLGNFSFGDYFKEESIKWAWEFITEVLEIKKERLSVSVHTSDGESYDIWKDVIGVSTERILRLGDEDNFWGPAGGTGPCGPCTEILYEIPGGLLELWNIVFLQYNQDESGGRKPLKNRGVDTGMGLERLTMVCQGVRTTYETDLFLPIIEEAERLLSSKYNDGRESFHIIADHIRALVFALSEGVYPSNEARGYFARKILRRALLEGTKLKLEKPFLYNLVPVVVGIMEDSYPGLLKKRENIALMVKSEEEKFLSTLREGTEVLEKVMKELEDTKLPPHDVFRLYDTYGLPPELTCEIARERGYTVNIEEVEKIVQGEKEKARRSSMFKVEVKKGWREFITIERDEFVGYDTLTTESEIARVRSEGGDVELILVSTPFYAESGGQVGDTGRIFSDNFEIEVLDTKLEAGFHIHIGKVKRIDEGGELRGHIICEVDRKRRRLVQANHTATHLLQSALRHVLGEHVRQEGSWVGKDRFRFDFTHFSRLSEREIRGIEQMVNDWILENIQVSIRYTTLKEARELGAIALFGEKYEEPVRMVQIGDISLELCGGTHVKNTGEIGIFKIVSEIGVHTGIRRIEAVTSMGVMRLLLDYGALIENIRGSLKTSDIEVGVDKLLRENRTLKGKLKELRRSAIGGGEKIKDRLTESNIAGIQIKTGYFAGLNGEDLRELSDGVRRKPHTVCVVATTKENKPLFVVSVSDDLKDKLNAGKIAALLGKLAGGGGGGKPHLAEAGGRPDADIEDILTKVGEIVTSLQSSSRKRSS